MMPSTLDRALADVYGEPAPRASLVALQGDASTRRYYRAEVESPRGDRPRTIIVMQLPSDAFRSDEGGAEPSTQRLPFLEVAALLESRGLPVPKVYAEDLRQGIVLLEDLGDLTLHEKLQQSPQPEWAGLYIRAVELLAEIHERCADLPSDSIVTRRSFDHELLRWELDHFREWGVEALFGPLEPHDRLAMDDTFERLAREIEGMPYGFVHRDYQSKNLMVRPTGELALIDFQDALLGPRSYDLVALLCDSYVALHRDLQEAMIERYAALRRIDSGAIRREFWAVALHRKLKDAGRFVFIDRVRRNPDFLRWFPQSLVYVGRALVETSGYDDLSALLRGVIPGFPDAVAQPASVME